MSTTEKREVNHDAEIDADQRAPLWDDVKMLAIIAVFIGGVSAFSVGVFWLLGALGQAN
jgi:hypothetical protein